MPTFTVLLAQDVTYYGNVSVEGDTWQEAVASLTLDDWDNCDQMGEGGWEQRVVHVETESGDVLAESEDINYDCALVHYMPVIDRLTTIMDTCDVPDDAAAALVAYIDELQGRVQDPIFRKGETDQ